MSDNLQDASAEINFGNGSIKPSSYQLKGRGLAFEEEPEWMTIKKEVGFFKKWPQGRLFFHPKLKATRRLIFRKLPAQKNSIQIFYGFSDEIRNNAQAIEGIKLKVSIGVKTVLEKEVFPTPGLTSERILLTGRHDTNETLQIEVTLAGNDDGFYHFFVDGYLT